MLDLVSSALDKTIIGIRKPPNPPIPPASPPNGAAPAVLDTLGIHLNMPQLHMPNPTAKKNNPTIKLGLSFSFLG